MPTVTLAAQKYLIVAILHDNKVIITLHSGTVLIQNTRCLPRADGVYEGCEHVVPGVEGQYGAVLKEQLVEAGRFRVLASLVVAQVAVVAGQCHFITLFETGKDVEALEMSHACTTEILHYPAILWLYKQFLHFLVSVLHAQGGTLVEKVLVLKLTGGQCYA